MGDLKHFDVRIENDVTVAVMIDPAILGALILTELAEELEKFIVEQQPQKLVVDFAQVTRCSTEVINSLLQARTRLLKLGGRLALCGMSDPIRSEFRLLQLEGTTFAIHDDLSAAVASLRDPLPPSPYKHIRIQTQADGVTIMHLIDSAMITNQAVSEVDDEVEEFVSRHKPPKLLINFGPVSQCSTAVINSLLRARNRLIKNGAQLKLCGMSKNIRSEFAMLNLDNGMFDIYDSASGAIAAFDD